MERGFGENKGSAYGMLLFLIGLFSATQIRIGGKLGISEFVMVLLAPFLFLRNVSLLKRDKVLYFFVLIILWVVGAIVSDIVNGTYFNFAMRGIAVPITVFANTLCI